MSHAFPMMIGAAGLTVLLTSAQHLPTVADASGGPAGRGVTLAVPLEGCPPDSLYAQVPTDPAGSWNAVTSDAGPGYRRYDSYLVDSYVQGVVWWGLMLHYDNGWFPCPGENPMDFTIEFRTDTGGPPSGPPLCSYSVTAFGEDTGEAYGDHAVYRFQAALDPFCSLPEGWLSIQGAGVGSPDDCWFLWCDSPDGDGNSWFWDGTAFQSSDLDLSMCLTGDFTPGALYLHGPDYDPFSPVADPTAFPWQELRPDYGASRTCVAWTDNGNGYLDVCDVMEFGDGTMRHVQDVTVTAVIEALEGGPAEDWIHVDYLQPPFADPIGPWREIHPFFGAPWDCTDWMDNGNGVLDDCDWLIFQTPSGSEFMHVVGVGTDLEVLLEAPGPCPADVNGDDVVNVLDLLAVLAAWGNAGGPEDINGDGLVNVLDLLAVLAAWGPCA